ncbi:MAG: flavin reductase family protein [Actinomycetota bacterium]|nr:flavin reductase family protein [Actinomycetota bacterium]
MIEVAPDLCHRILAPRIGYLVGTLGEDGPNVAPISNVTQVSRSPQVIVIAVSRKWKTYRNLSKRSGFSLSVPRVEHAEVVWRLAEKFSGFDIPSGMSKLEASGANLDYDTSRFGPILEGATGWLECELLTEAGLVDTDHGVFFGRVLGGGFNENYMQPDGKYLRNSSPLMQVVENSFATTTDHWTIPWLGSKAASHL